MKRRAFGLLSLLGVLLLGGCTEVSVNTRVRSDGSFRRTDVFTRHDPSSEDLSQITGSFVLPRGTPWSTTRVRGTDNTLRYTATRSYRGSDGLADDIRVRRINKGPVLVMNAATVRRIGPRRWQYVETLRWQGNLPKSLLVTPAEFVEAIRGTLPSSVSAESADEAAQALSARLLRESWHIAHGPHDPGLWKMDDDDAQKRVLRRLLARPVDRSVRAVLGVHLSDEDRRATVGRVLTVFAENENATEDLFFDQEDPNSSGLTLLRFTLQAPGRLVETNGTVNKRRPNEVTWACYPEAAALDDVELRATWDTAGYTGRPVKRGDGR